MLRIAVFVYSYVYAIVFFLKNIFSVNKTDVHVFVLLFIELFDFLHVWISYFSNVFLDPWGISDFSSFGNYEMFIDY